MKVGKIVDRYPFHILFTVIFSTIITGFVAKDLTHIDFLIPTITTSLAFSFLGFQLNEKYLDLAPKIFTIGFLSLISFACFIFFLTFEIGEIGYFGILFFTMSLILIMDILINGIQRSLKKQAQRMLAKGEQ